MSYPKHRKSSVYPENQKRNVRGQALMNCFMCGKEGILASRTKENNPVCPSCHNKNLPKTICGQCGVEHGRNTRIRDGSSLCGKCYFQNRPKIACLACGKSHLENTKSITKDPLCITCFRLYRNGFLIEQIQVLAQKQMCDYPNCLVQKHSRSLCADHLHGAPCEKDHRYYIQACPKCFRGMICYGHNRLLADLDQYPNEVNEEAKLYLGQKDVE
jgi:hypothetical protein